MGLSMVWDLEKAGRLGTAAGGLVIQGLRSDAGIVNLDQTIEFLNTAEELPINTMAEITFEEQQAKSATTSRAGVMRMAP